MVFQLALFAMSFGTCDPSVARCESISQPSHVSLTSACNHEGEQVFYQHPKLERNDYYEVVCVLNRVYSCRLALTVLQSSELPNTYIMDTKYGDLSYSCLVYPTQRK